MNAERLHAIALAIQHDLEVTQSPSLLAQLADALQYQVNDPANPDYPQQVGQFREQLDAALSGAPSNGFSPAWHKATVELEVAHLLGNELRERLDEIFGRNQITTPIAHQEIQPLASKLTELSAALENLLAGFDVFSIGNEELEPGEFEFGVLIPRDAVDNELAALGDELRKLDEIFLPFTELVSGSRPQFQVRSISSSDFSVFVDAAPQVAAAIAVGITWVLATYKQLLEIRRLRDEMKRQGVPETKLGGVDEHADDTMAEGIGKAVEALIKDFGKSLQEPRQHEMRTALKLSLNAISNRVDRGYNIEVRAEPLQPEAESDGEEGEQAIEESPEYSIVEERRGEMQFINLSGEKILSLPEKTDDPDEPVEEPQQSEEPNGPVT